MFENIDYLSVARSRYTDQFKDSVNFDILMIVWMMGYQEIQETLLSLITIKDVDAATGVQLDVIGDIVGQPRTLENIDATGYFGFYSDPGAQPFGSLSTASGGIYNSLYDSGSSGNTSLPDGTYRSFIKAKIISNNSAGTSEDIITAARALFSTDIVEFGDDPTSGVFSLYIGRPWNDEALTAFPGLDETVVATRLLPIPAGVRIEFRDSGEYETFYAVNRYETAANALDTTVNIELYKTIGEDKF